MIKPHPSITDPKRMARRIAELTERVEQLEAENERLRAALQETGDE